MARRDFPTISTSIGGVFTAVYLESKLAGGSALQDDDDDVPTLGHGPARFRVPGRSTVPRSYWLARLSGCARDPSWCWHLATSGMKNAGIVYQFAVSVPLSHIPGRV